MKLEYVGDALIIVIFNPLSLNEEKLLKRRISYIMQEYGIKKLVINLQ